MSARKVRTKSPSLGYASYSLSDSEADPGFISRNVGSYLPALPEEGQGYVNRYSRIGMDMGNQTDHEEDDGGGSSHSLEEFGEHYNTASRLVRTGRQRKKLAARSKGGEFRQRRRKRRLYFCCVSSEIDVQKLYDYLVGAGSLLHGWKYQLQAEVLHLFKPGQEDQHAPTQAATPPVSQASGNTSHNSGRNSGRHSGRGQQSWLREQEQEQDHEVDHLMDGIGGESVDIDEMIGAAAEAEMGLEMRNSLGGEKRRTSSIGADDELMREHTRKAFSTSANSEEWKISGSGAQEVFVFEFGAVVFWGFSRGEETNLLKTIRMFVTKGFVGPHEFQSGEDDMAFVTAPDAEAITIANDVFTLPDNSPTKQRMSVSFAIAQSTVLAIFEARVERKVEDYRYIPEALAASGRVQLSERQLGVMIGEVFVIRHDVNLHTEILDTPDFFWYDGQQYEGDYKMVMRYLEMSGRTEVLNKRLDMLRELLDVLQQQMENAHAVKLEWIVIWLIVVEVVLQVFAVGGESLGLWKAIPS